MPPKTTKNSSGDCYVVRKPPKQQSKRRPESLSDSVFIPNALLPESFVIDITGPNFVRSMTVHRPIGFVPDTMSRKESWIISDTTSIKQLLQGAKDPDEAKLQANRSKERESLAVSAGKLTLKPNEQTPRFPQTGNIRGPLVKAARKAFQASKKEKQKKVSQGYTSYLSEEKDREDEIALEAFYKAPTTVAQVEMKYPDTGYITRSGNSQDIDQVECKEYRGIPPSILQLRILREITGLGRTPTANAVCSPGTGGTSTKSVQAKGKQRTNP
jgi:hypothetical protein